MTGKSYGSIVAARTKLSTALSNDLNYLAAVLTVARKQYVNVQDQNIFAVIHPVNDEVVARYPVGAC
jgi:hypothetical protein